MSEPLLPMTDSQSLYAIRDGLIHVILFLLGQFLYLIVAIHFIFRRLRRIERRVNVDDTRTPEGEK